MRSTTLRYDKPVVKVTNQALHILRYTAIQPCPSKRDYFNVLDEEA